MKANDLGDNGYLRLYNNGYIRVVIDRRKTYEYLMERFYFIDEKFFKWLRKAKVGETYNLAWGPGEFWIMAVNWK